MDLSIVPFKATKANSNLWRVTATGYGGDDDAQNSEVIYQGPDEQLAKRTHLEILALARVFPNGRGGGEEYDYSEVVRDLFGGFPARYGKNPLAQPGKPFEWARGCWSRDVTAGDAGGDATIVDSRVEWIDGNGAACEVSVALTPRESELLRSIPAADPPRPYPVGALIVFDEVQQLESLAPEAPSSGRRRSI